MNKKRKTERKIIELAGELVSGKLFRLAELGEVYEEYEEKFAPRKPGPKGKKENGSK